MIHNIRNVQKKLLPELFDNKKTGSLGWERDWLNLFSHSNRNSTQTCPNQRREFNDLYNFKVQGYPGAGPGAPRMFVSVSSLQLSTPLASEMSFFLVSTPWPLSSRLILSILPTPREESFFPLSSNPGHALTLIGQNWLTHLTEPITLAKAMGYAD